ncbi:MAG TPA: lysophospholipase [Myxococcaceae bacterium]|nr:lysophospholipase [Myxococcaceae bacterium]
MNHTQDAFEGAGGLKLCSQSWRPEGTAQAVLAIVHGFGEHSGRYTNVVRHFVPRGYAVHGFDLRGHGRSPGQRGHINSWAEYREDVKAFLGHVARQEPGRPVFLLGHSLGSIIALDYALHHPLGLSGLILSGLAVDPVGAATPLLVATARLMSRIWPTLSMAVKLDKAALSRIPEVVSEYIADPLVHGLGSARWGTECLDAIAWCKAHASRLQLPLLVVHGDSDRINTAAGARLVFEAARSQDKRLVLVPGGHHEPHNDLGREQTFQALEEYLGKRLSAAA